jgi:hypothetical protein
MEFPGPYCLLRKKKKVWNRHLFRMEFVEVVISFDGIVVIGSRMNALLPNAIGLNEEYGSWKSSLI